MLPKEKMTLSYGSQFGYYGLRENPTLEQVIGSVRKPLRIPLPDRRAKWYALSPYRALILDAEREANDYGRLLWTTEILEHICPRLPLP